MEVWFLQNYLLKLMINFTRASNSLVNSRLMFSHLLLSPVETGDRWRLGTDQCNETFSSNVWNLWWLTIKCPVWEGSPDQFCHKISPRFSLISFAILFIQPVVYSTDWERIALFRFTLLNCILTNDTSSNSKDIICKADLTTCFSGGRTKVKQGYLLHYKSKSVPSCGSVERTVLSERVVGRNWTEKIVVLQSDSRWGLVVV